MDRNEVGPILAAQINTLLTEIENYEGVIIFTTNRLGKLDPALERRISAKIEFPFPDEQARISIWKRMIPDKAPIHKSVDFSQLSKHPLTGGNIKNAVLNAARSAAYKGEKYITMEHFIDAIEREKEAIEAFSESYNNSPHYQQAGLGYNPSGSSLEVKESVDIKKKMNINNMLGGKKHG